MVHRRWRSEKHKQVHPREKPLNRMKPSQLNLPEEAGKTAYCHWASAAWSCLWNGIGSAFDLLIKRQTNVLTQLRPRSRILLANSTLSFGSYPIQCPFSRRSTRRCSACPSKKRNHWVPSHSVPMDRAWLTLSLLSTSSTEVNSLVVSSSCCWM